MTKEAKGDSAIITAFIITLEVTRKAELWIWDFGLQIEGTL